MQRDHAVAREEWRRNERALEETIQRISAEKERLCKVPSCSMAKGSSRDDAVEGLIQLIERDTQESAVRRAPRMCSHLRLTPLLASRRRRPTGSKESRSGE